MSISELRQILDCTLANCLDLDSERRTVRLIFAFGSEKPCYQTCSDDHYQADNDTPAVRVEEEVSKGCLGWRRWVAVRSLGLGRGGNTRSAWCDSWPCRELSSEEMYGELSWSLRVCKLCELDCKVVKLFALP